MASQCPNGLTRHYCNESCTWEHSNAAGVHSWLSDVQTILFVLASNWNGRLGLSLALCMRIVLSCEVHVLAVLPYIWLAAGYLSKAESFVHVRFVCAYMCLRG